MLRLKRCKIRAVTLRKVSKKTNEIKGFFHVERKSLVINVINVMKIIIIYTLSRGTLIF